MSLAAGTSKEAVVITDEAIAECSRCCIDLVAHDALRVS